MTEAELLTLKNCFLFGGDTLPQSVVELCPEFYNKGERVCDNKRGCNGMGVVLEGRLVAVPNGETRAVLSQFSSGDCFGVAAMFGGNGYVTKITAARDSKVLFFSEEFLKALFAERPQLAVNYITFLSSRIRLLNQKISLFASADSTARVYSYILSHCDSDGKFDDGGNMSLLAKTLGIGRTTLYREINRLCEQKLINKQNGTYYVL